MACALAMWRTEWRPQLQAARAHVAPPPTSTDSSSSWPSSWSPSSTAALDSTKAAALPVAASASTSSSSSSASFSSSSSPSTSSGKEEKRAHLPLPAAALPAPVPESDGGQLFEQLCLIERFDLLKFLGTDPKTCMWIGLSILFHQNSAALALYRLFFLELSIELQIVARSLQRLSWPQQV